MKHGELARITATGVLPAAFPWVRDLPKEDLQAFVVELVDVLERVESLRDPASVAQLITEWRHTAESTLIRTSRPCCAAMGMINRRCSRKEWEEVVDQGV